MNKEEFTALGISEELAKKAEEASKKELEGYVEKSKFEETEKENQTLKTSVKDRDKQLEDLKKSSGDNEELKKQIETLQDENKAAKEKYDAEMKELKLTTAIKLAVAGKVHDEDIAAGLFDRSKLILSDDGKVSGLEEQLKTIQKEKAFLFKDTEPPAGSNTKPKPPYKPKDGSTHNEGYAVQIASQKNEAEKSTASRSLWNAE